MQATLENLVTELRSHGEDLPSCLGQVFDDFNLELKDFVDLVHFKDDSYLRLYLERDDNFDLLLLCWKSGQLTPIHDHRGSACYMKVLTGVATEIVFDRSACGLLMPRTAVQHEMGAATMAFDSDIHQVGNLQAEENTLVTLHCYSPPLQGMTTYFSEETFFRDYDAVTHRRLRVPSESLGPRQL